MAVDYDLVILGGTVYGRAAALQAVGYGARIALVEPPGLFEQQQQQKYLLQGLRQIGEICQRRTVGEQFGLAHGGELDWQAVLRWSAIAAETQQAHLSVEAMSAEGVDVVLEAPQRLTRQLMTVTSSRRLSARSVLAAYGELPKAIETLQSIQRLPQSISVIGGSPEAIEWARALSDCCIAVTLIADEILPHEDSDIRRLMRLQLEALGIKMSTESDQKKEAALQRNVLEIGSSQPVLELPSFITQIKNKSKTNKPEENKLRTNRRLQTNHPRVFACGSALGGSTSEGLARYEAAIALRNALFLPTAKTHYESVPRIYSEFARVGLTEAQARQRYGSAVQASASSCADPTCLTRMNPLLNYRKLIYANNRLVGAHAIGEKAPNLVGLLANRLGQPVEDYDMLMEISSAQQSNRFAPHWQPRHWQPGHWQRDWAENWFNWRRSRRGR